jgi:hypothetical protein
MPRLLWKDGITSLTELTAKYKVGIMFSIVTMAFQNEGKRLFEDVLGGNARLNDMRQVFQMMLAYLGTYNNFGLVNLGKGGIRLKLTSNCMFLMTLKEMVPSRITSQVQQSTITFFVSNA